MKLQRILLFPILLLMFVGVGVCSPTWAAGTPPPGGSPPVSDLDFTPEIPLPKVFEGSQRADNNLLTHYIQAIFIYFIWVIGIIAVVMVMYGGIRWVAAAGNPGQINEARDIVNGAIIGILIALSAVVLLNIINPKLTKLSVPGLTYIKAGTPGFTQFNKDYGCYENMTCSADFQQTLGGACGGAVVSGIYTYANPGTPNCTSGNKLGICCQGTTESTKSNCVGYDPVTLKINYNGSCHAVSGLPIPDVKCIELPCGEIATDRHCQGISCTSGSACYLQGSKGTCIPPEAYYSYPKIEAYPKCNGLKTWYTASIPCGLSSSTLDDKSNVITGIGSGPCPAGKYCAALVPTYLNDQCALVSVSSCTPIK